MCCSVFTRLSMLAVAMLLLSAAGCPSPLPPAAKPDAVQALEAAGAVLKKNSAGAVTDIELDSAQGSDEQLKHLKDLPSVQMLSAVEARGVTDAGLALLAGHPSLREIKLERSGV